MRRFKIPVVVSWFAALTALPCVSVIRADGNDPRPSALVPAYFYPAGPGQAAWYQLAENARTRNIEVILNPASGPGAKRDPTYVKVVNDLRKAGGKVLGYIPTNYAKREIAAIERDLRSYLNFYEVDGIFLDETDGKKEAVPYYLNIRAMIKRVKPNFRIVANPGQPWVDELHMKAVDCLVMFEGSAAKYAQYDPDQVSAWMKKYPASRFAAIVHTVASPDAMRKALQRAEATRAGWVFITNREMPNPYDALPAYWAQELGQIESRKLADTRK